MKRKQLTVSIPDLIVSKFTWSGCHSVATALRSYASDNSTLTLVMARDELRKVSAHLKKSSTNVNL